MDLLKLLHRKYFLPFAKQNQAEDFKSCWSFCFELKLLSGSKYSMPWVLCAFGNVYIWDIELIPLSSLIHQTEQSWIWHLFEQKPKLSEQSLPHQWCFKIVHWIDIGGDFFIIFSLKFCFVFKLWLFFLTYLFPSDLHKSTYVSNNGYTQICPGIGKKNVNLVHSVFSQHPDTIT